MNQTFAGIVISALLVSGTLWLHFKALRRGSSYIVHLQAKAKKAIMMIMSVIFIAHILEIVLFSIAYWLMIPLGLGNLAGNHTSTAADFFYFSIATYTTLGIGDIAPEGAIRIVAGVEALAGLVLITWSASFTYLVMERFWQDDLTD